jgi:hypothetical protein
MVNLEHPRVSRFCGFQQSTISNQRENEEVDGGWLIVDG